MTQNQIPELNVAFLGCSKDPLEILYSAYIIAKKPEKITSTWQQFQEKTISREEMAAILPAKKKDHYSTNLRQAQFVFKVENISRISSISLNRASTKAEGAGIICAAPQAQNSRELAVTPPSFQRSQELIKKWFDLQAEIDSFYKTCLDLEISADDAAFALPQGLLCSEQLSMSSQAMQQFLDSSMCEETSWELKKLSNQIYQIMKREFPSLSGRLGIKCWENRNLFCDEPYERYKMCKWSKTRPHQSHLNNLWRNENRPELEKTLM